MNTSLAATKLRVSSVHNYACTSLRTRDIGGVEVKWFGATLKDFFPAKELDTCSAGI
jgi:hypothetical protein